MKKIFNTIVHNPQNNIYKFFLLVLFVLIFTGTDLFVKQIAYDKLRNKPDVVVIPGFWVNHYVINDDIGFSALRWIEKYFGVPKEINKSKFEGKILKKLDSDFKLNLIKDYYAADSSSGNYILKSQLSDYDREVIKRILVEADYRTGKWIFLVILQGLGTVFVISFFFYAKRWKYLLPLALIVCGALGNVLDRIIRGYVVDYVMWTVKFIPLRIFNPWPIFNLADVFTVIGSVALFIILFFFTTEEDKQNKFI